MISVWVIFIEGFLLSYLMQILRKKEHFLLEVFGCMIKAGITEVVVLLSNYWIAKEIYLSSGTT